MGFSDRILQGLKGVRTTLADPDAWLTTALTGGTSYSGKSVTPDNSMELIPVYSAVSLLAGAVGSIPLKVYKDIDNARATAEDYVQWELLHDNPNPEMAADEVWEMVTAHLLLWGNAFLAKERNKNGQVTALWPLKPSRCAVGREAGKRFFSVDNNGKRYTEKDILHIRGLGLDGIVGLSPIQLARQSLGKDLALEEFGGRFWSNSAHPQGVLEHPNKLNEEAAGRLKAAWHDAHGGLAKSSKIAVLEEGMSWKATGMPLEDAQFIETQKFSLLQIALLFRVPPHMIGAQVGDSMTYATVEGQSIDFVRWSLRRWLKRIEGSLKRDQGILKPVKGLYAEFLTDDLLRGETKSRYEAYAEGIGSRFLTVNEVRAKENMPPVPGGDDFTGKVNNANTES